MGQSVSAFVSDSTWVQNQATDLYNIVTGRLFLHPEGLKVFSIKNKHLENRTKSAISMEFSAVHILFSVSPAYYAELETNIALTFQIQLLLEKDVYLYPWKN